MKNVQILIVEDDDTNALQITTRLKRLGYEVCKRVTNGIDAIEEVKKGELDIILMDISILGELDGIETAKKIQEFSNIPIIYLTASANQQTIDRAKETMPCGYLVKPVQERDLRIAIEVDEISILKDKVEENNKIEKIEEIA